MGIRVNNLLRFVHGHEPDVNALSARLDGQLDAAAAARLDEHVASCEACRIVRDGLRATRDALRAMPVATPPHSFRLRAADVERAAARASGPSLLSRWAPAGMVAAAVAIAVVGAYVTFGRGGSSSTSELAAARPATSASVAESSNTTNSATGKSVPGPSGGAPPVVGSPVGADAATPLDSRLPPTQQAATKSSITTDASGTPPAPLAAPYSGSSTPTPSAGTANTDVAAPSVAGGLRATPTSDAERNKLTDAVVIAITW
jgi:hypothetical protein